MEISHLSAVLMRPEDGNVGTIHEQQPIDVFQWVRRHLWWFFLKSLFPLYQRNFQISSEESSYSGGPTPPHVTSLTVQILWKRNHADDQDSVPKLELFLPNLLQFHDSIFRPNLLKPGGGPPGQRSARRNVIVPFRK